MRGSRAAAFHAANAEDYNRLVRLLVELSTIAAVDQKGADYILDNPDLTVVAQDDDALRRLFETRTKWPGARHARLAIANVLSGDLDEAYRHHKGAEEWILHDLRKRDQEHDLNQAGPEQLDHASVPIFLISQGQSDRALGFMRIWYHWYGFALCEHVFSCLRLAEGLPEQSPDLHGFLHTLSNEIGCIAGGLSFLELPEAERRHLIDKLAKACSRATDLTHPQLYSSERPYELSDGLRKAAADAASLGLDREALMISLRAPHERPRVWSYQDHHLSGNVFPFLFRIALKSAVKGTSLHERDVLPADLAALSKSIERSITGDEFRRTLKAKLERQMQKQRDNKVDGKQRISMELKDSADRFIDNRLGPILELTAMLADLLRAPQRQADGSFLKLVNTWAKVRVLKDRYSTQEFNQFLRHLGSSIVTFSLWVRSDLRTSSVKVFLQRLDEQPVGPSLSNRIVTILALRPRLHHLAGEQALKSKALIDQEDDVNIRASLYAELARAILPASQEDAATYFRTGVEQMDAIGSGDYDFTNELLLFASSTKGGELPEKDFHTLTNICELNMSYEEHKFPWASFGAGLSKAAGWRALPKLCRWHDRSKIGLEYTLLPYLTALVRDGKIEPADALSLNCLADPAELWACNTETFANAIHEGRFSNDKELVTELIRQFEANNTGIASKDTNRALASIVADVLGKRHATTKYLSIAEDRFRHVIEELNEQQNFRPRDELGRSPAQTQNTRKTNRELRQLAERTDPLNEDSLTVAIEELNQMAVSREFETIFFDRLRSRVPFGQRSTYVRLITGLENLDTYAKFGELGACKELWGRRFRRPHCGLPTGCYPYIAHSR
jgi:hypothetical protein